jgi:Rrf2 family protein
MSFFALRESNIISIHFMALIAAAGDNGISVKAVSDLTGCSKHHLSKLMDKLVKAGLVKSKRGQTGGFYLNKKSSEVFLIDVLEAISGKIEEEVICPSGRNICEGNHYMFGDLCHDISNQFITYLKSTSLADIKDHAAKIL